MRKWVDSSSCRLIWLTRTSFVQHPPNLRTRSSSTDNFLPSHAKPGCTCSLASNRGLISDGMGRHHDLQVIVSIILPYHWTLPEINRENRSSRIQLNSPDSSTELFWQASRTASFTSLDSSYWGGRVTGDMRTREIMVATVAADLAGSLQKKTWEYKRIRRIFV